MDTPDLTAGDGIGVAGAFGVIAMGLQASSVAVQLASVIMVGLIGIAIVWADTKRRGARAEFLSEGLHSTYTGDNQ